LKITVALMGLQIPGQIGTTPGMTATSFIPQQIAAMGKTLGEVLTDIIQDRLHD
jgi:hypothetical protein